MEAIIMQSFKLNRFFKSLGDATLVNSASVLIIFLVVGILADIEVGMIDSPLVITGLGLFIVTSLTEGVVLKLLNKKLPWRRLLLTSAVMNLVTYILLYFYYITSFNP